MQLYIPKSIVQSIRLPENRLKSELLKELALSIYQQELLFWGKARELAKMEYRKFAALLGARKIERHYSKAELIKDLNYAHS